MDFFENAVRTYDSVVAESIQELVPRIVYNVSQLRLQFDIKYWNMLMHSDVAVNFYCFKFCMRWW